MLSYSFVLVAIAALVAAVVLRDAAGALCGALALHLVLSLAPLPTKTVGASVCDGLELAFQVVQLVVAIPIWVATTYISLGVLVADLVRPRFAAAADVCWRCTAAPRRALVQKGCAAWHNATMWYALSLVVALVLVRETLSLIDFVFRTTVEAWGCFVWPRLVQYARDRVEAVKAYVPDLSAASALVPPSYVDHTVDDDHTPPAPPPSPVAVPVPVLVVVPPTPPTRASAPAAILAPPRADWVPGPYPARPCSRPRRRRCPVPTIVEGEPLEGVTQEEWVARAEASAAVAGDYVWVLRDMEEKAAAGVPIFVIRTEADKARNYVRRHNAHERDMRFWAAELLHSQLDY